MPKTDPSDVLILAGSAGLAAFVGHFWGGWAVLLAVSIAVVVCGAVALAMGR